MSYPFRSSDEDSGLISGSLLSMAQHVHVVGPQMEVPLGSSLDKSCVNRQKSRVTERASSYSSISRPRTRACGRTNKNVRGSPPRLEASLRQKLGLCHTVQPDPA